MISTNVDRAAAYAAMSALFVFAYPRHWWTVVVLVIVTAGGAELSQFLSPMRHPQLMDAAVKAAGGVFGLIVGLLLYFATARFSNRQPEKVLPPRPTRQAKPPLQPSRPAPAFRRKRQAELTD